MISKIISLLEIKYLKFKMWLCKKITKDSYLNDSCGGNCKCNHKAISNDIVVDPNGESLNMAELRKYCKENNRQYESLTEKEILKFKCFGLSTFVTDEKIQAEIIKEVFTPPSKEAKDKNKQCMELVRKLRE